ncbi:hypothetical protein [uncultured Psychroserpens sp.]|uniref:hypothetical protein n=1 Tax=uncultured Psychroserpens sp. TaxID=255436 RepID=UPI0026249834|nr:hypothetical protein [uncultured Psychroserpens sp.]
MKARLASTRSFSAADETKEQIEIRKKIQQQITNWESISYAEIETFCKNSTK